MSNSVVNNPSSAFSPAACSALAAYANGNVLLAFDFDGTLAPLTDDPSRAALASSTRTLLRSLTTRYPVAVLSGRRADGIARRVEKTGVWIAIDHHAMWIDRSRSALELREQVARWRDTIRQALAGRLDIRIEDKEFALAVHYRQAPHQDETLRAIVDAVQAVEGAHVVFGDHVVNMSPPGALSKAEALQCILRDFSCGSVIYVGDDAEDEPIFRLKATLPLLGIRVGAIAGTAAPYSLTRQRDIDRLLEHLGGLRASHAP